MQPIQRQLTCWHVAFEALQQSSETEDKSKGFPYGAWEEVWRGRDSGNEAGIARRPTEDGGHSTLHRGTHVRAGGEDGRKAMGHPGGAGELGGDAAGGERGDGRNAPREHGELRREREGAMLHDRRDGAGRDEEVDDSSDAEGVALRGGTRIRREERRAESQGENTGAQGESRTGREGNWGEEGERERKSTADAGGAGGARRGRTGGHGEIEDNEASDMG